MVLWASFQSDWLWSCWTCNAANHTTTMSRNYHQWESDTLFASAQRLGSFLCIGRENSFDYTAAEFRVWAGEVGFTSTQILPLVGSTAAAIAYK